MKVLLKIKNKEMTFLPDDFWNLLRFIDCLVEMKEPGNEFENGVLLWIKDSWSCSDCSTIYPNEIKKCKKCLEN